MKAKDETSESIPRHLFSATRFQQNSGKQRVWKGKVKKAISSVPYLRQKSAYTRQNAEDAWLPELEMNGWRFSTWRNEVHVHPS
jgi:hypothetical protein